MSVGSADPTADRPLRVLRIAHHGVVSGWRERERELERQGVDLTLVSALTWNEGGRDQTYAPDGDDFGSTARTWGRHPSVFVMDPRPLWRELGKSWDLIDLHEEPNALITAEVLVMQWLRRRRTPFVLYSAQNIDKRYPPPFSWIEGHALRHAAGVYVCNTEASEILHRKGLRAPVPVIGLGVDLGQFAPGERPPPAGVLRVGYAGRLEPHKGVSVLLKAMALLPEATLELVGGGPEREALEAQAATLGITERVQFAGYVGPGLPDFYRRVDVLAVPSLPTKGWLEQFGRVVVEAMASGLPVVASSSGALPDVVGDAGLLVPPGDAAALAAALDRLRDPVVWTTLRERGLVAAQQYGWPEIAREQLDLYRVAVQRDGQPLDSEQPPQVIVVAYGSPEPLELALGKLDGRLPVTVVDNSSLAETAEAAARHGAHYVDSGANLGFAGGVNTGLRSLAARGLDTADVLLLNPDAEITPDGVLELQRALHADPELAAVAPAQTSPVTGEAEQVVWPFPSPATAWLTAVGAGKLDRRHGYLIGSILLLRRAAIDDVGEFDERFFLYAEETDWQYRATRRGWKTKLVPEVHGHHVGAGTGGSTSRRLALFHGSLLTYMEKHYGKLGRASFRTAMLAGSAVRSVAARGAARDGARDRLKLYLRPPVRPDAS